jgi:hypothetical protein
MTTSPTLPDEKVAVCPLCDAASVQVNSPASYAPRNPDAAAYRCGSCFGDFEEFEVRDRESPVDSLCGLAKRLDDASPEEVGR